MLNELYAKTMLMLSSASVPVEITSELVAFTLLICFVGLANLETRLPKIKRPARQMRQSYKTNISLFVFNNILISLCSVSTLLMVAERYSSSGLLNAVSSPVLKALLSFLAVDLLLYVWHQACHRVDALWMFHRVHHNDPYLNVSTAFRLHFVEVVATNSLKALLIIILGMDKILVLMVETCVTLSIMFHHANIAFKYERIMGRVMIVPYLHRVHHSTERNEHDRNYGAMLSVWDRLFGTLSEIEPKRIGIKGSSPQDLFSLITFGFGWETPVYVRPAPHDLDMMIAEAAYYKAEKRNFYPGYDFRDWLEAKAEILNQVENKGSRRHSGWGGKASSFKLMLQNFNCTLQQQSLKDFIPFGVQSR